jgi:acyl carrier protein
MREPEGRVSRKATLHDPVVGSPADLATGPVETPASVVARVFGLGAEPDETARPDETSGWDSLGMLELVLALEASFGVTIDERRLADVHCVGDFSQLVR